jgi:SAM-dependent methyltransferase
LRSLGRGAGDQRRDGLPTTRGAEVSAIDIGEDVIETTRALDPEGKIDFRVADAEALPFPDCHFDGVISTFGVMFCGDLERAAHELARVCKPAGRLSLATWAPNGSVFGMFKLIRSYMPPPKKVTPSPFEWGDTDRLVDLLGDEFNLGFEEATSFYRESNGAAARQAFSTGFGPVVTALKPRRRRSGPSPFRFLDLSRTVPHRCGNFGSAPLRDHCGTPPSREFWYARIKDAATYLGLYAAGSSNPSSLAWHAASCR